MNTYFLREGAAGSGLTPYDPTSPLVMSWFPAGSTFYLLGRTKTLTGIPDGTTIRGDYPGMPGELFGAYNASSPDVWEEQGNNLWTCSHEFGAETRIPSWLMLGDIEQDNVSRVINEPLPSEDTTTAQDMNEQGQCWFNRENYTFTVYSNANPSDVYSQVLIPEASYGVWLEGSTGVSIRNMAITLFMMGAVRLTDCSDCNVIGNRASYTGGGNSQKEHARAGDGIGTDGSCSNINFHYNKVSQSYDIGMSAQAYGKEATVNTGISFMYNTFYRCCGGTSIAAHTDLPHLMDAVVSDNTIIETGYGWAGMDDNAVHGMGLGMKETPLATVEVVHERNTVIGCAWAGFRPYSGYSVFRNNTIVGTTGDYAVAFETGADAYPAGIRISGGSPTPNPDSDITDFRGIIEGNVVVDNNCPSVFSINNKPQGPSGVGLDVINNLLYNGTTGLVALGSEFNFEHNRLYQKEGTEFVDGMAVGDNVYEVI